jgi:hypothetical protein
MNGKGCGRKRSSLNLKFCPCIYLVGLRKTHEKLWLEQSVCQASFEPRACRTHVRSFTDWANLLSQGSNTFQTVSIVLLAKKSGGCEVDVRFVLFRHDSWSMGWTARVRFLALQDFSLLYCVQTDTGVHPASYSMGTEGYFFGSKAAGAWSWSLTSI